MTVGIISDGDSLGCFQRTEDDRAAAGTKLGEIVISSCPCGSDLHVLATHRHRIRFGFTPVFGAYLLDDPIAEHCDGESDSFPQPDCCLACASGKRKHRSRERLRRARSGPQRSRQAVAPGPAHAPTPHVNTATSGE